jgi:hypothetical protein
MGVPKGSIRMKFAETLRGFVASQRSVEKYALVLTCEAEVALRPRTKSKLFPLPASRVKLR